MQIERLRRSAILAVLLLAVSPAVARAGVNRWTPFGPSDAPILSFAVDPAAANHLVAGLLFGGVIRSTDGGTSWRPAGLDNEMVTELAASGTSVYAFTATGKLYVSAPGAPAGSGWRTLHGGEAFRGASPGAVAAARLAIGRDGLLFLGLGEAGLFRSRDGGRHWQQVLSSNPPILSVAIDPRAPGHVYAAAFGEPSLFKSTDSGQTWTSLSVPLTEPAAGIQLLAIAPTSPSTIYAGSGYPGLYRSTDGGATWTKLSLADPNSDYLITSLTVDPDDPRTVYVATTFATWVSHDTGSSWVGNDPSPFDFTRALAVDPHTHLLYGASANTVGRSARGGRSWQQVFFQPDSGGVSRAKVVFDPTNPSSVYLLGLKALHSSDAGRTWSNIVLRGLSSLSIVTSMADWVFHPDDPDVVYAAGGGLMRSTDHGRSWRVLTVPEGGVRSLAVPGGQTVLAGGCGISRSADGGATWRRVFACQRPGAVDESSRSATELLVDPENPDTIYAEVSEVEGRHPVSFFTNLYRSRDGGRSWRRILAGGKALALDPDQPRTLYAVTNGDVLKSLDGGETWRPAGGGLPPTVSDLRIDRDTPSTLYASTFGEGVFRSTDGGATWRPLNTGLDPGELRVFRLDLHPTLPHHLYAVVVGGVAGIKLDE